MAFTKAYAKIMAGMLTDEQTKVFRVLAGKDDNVSDIPTSVLDELESLELVKPRAENVIKPGQILVLLTQKGKKVAEFV